MYLKVLVMEIKEKYCLVMTQDGEILRIKRKKDMKVGDQIFILQEDLYQGESEEQPVLQKKNKNRKIFWGGIAAVAASAVLLVGVSAYVNQMNASYALVSVDGAMSVQLELNKKGKVKKAISYDHTLTDAELKSLEGKELQEAAESLKLTTDDPKQKWLISYAFYQEETLKDAGFQKKLEAIFKEEDAFCLKGDKEDIEKAEEENKTLGNYLAEKEEERREKEEEKREEKQEERQEKQEEKEEEIQEKIQEKKELEEEKKEQETEKASEEEEEVMLQQPSQSTPVAPQVSEPKEDDWEPEESYEEEYEEDDGDEEPEDEEDD